MRAPLLFTTTLLAVELLGESIYGVQGAALPLIRNDLQLSYVEIGLLLSVPGLLGLVLDPLIGLLGDVWPRKALVVGGALATALAMLLVAGGGSFAWLMLAFCLAYPAGTAYVSLSQATLMDLHPGRHDQMMARWMVLGAIGQIAGPAAVAGVLALGIAWRNVYLALATLAGLAALVFWRQPFQRAGHAKAPAAWRETLRALPAAVTRSGLLRWIVLLALTDLMLSVFYSFCALYFTDVVKVSPAQAGLAVAALSFSGLVGDAVLIPLLERVDGLRVIRTSALLVLGVYLAFLLVPGMWAKLALLVLLGPLRSGWYQVLQGRAYSSLPGRSGTVIALTSLSRIAVAVFPLVLGALAGHVGLAWAMLLLAIAPLSLVVGLPPGRPRDTGLV